MDYVGAFFAKPLFGCVKNGREYCYNEKKIKNNNNQLQPKPRRNFLQIPTKIKKKKKRRRLSQKKCGRFEK
jgi:hypothetical protein